MFHHESLFIERILTSRQFWLGESIWIRWGHVCRRNFSLPRLYDASHLELVKHRSLNIQTVSSLLYCSFMCIKHDLAPVKIETLQSLIFVEPLFHVWNKHELATLPINQSHFTAGILGSGNSVHGLIIIAVHSG